MFGEDTMLGNKTVKIDEKGRIFLPKFTYAEIHDELILAKKDEILILFSFLAIKKRILELKKTYYSTSSKEIFDKIDNDIEELCNSCINNVTVDSQKRILIPKDTIAKYEFEDSVHIQGRDSYVKLLKK